MGKGDKEKRLKYWSHHSKPTQKKRKLLGIVRAKNQGRELRALLAAVIRLERTQQLKDSRLRAVLLPGAQRHVAHAARRVNVVPLVVPPEQIAAHQRAAYEVTKSHG